MSAKENLYSMAIVWLACIALFVFSIANNLHSVAYYTLWMFAFITSAGVLNGCFISIPKTTTVIIVVFTLFLSGVK